jgi:putative nucleotidyltransferase with HDIG domain
MTDSYAHADAAAAPSSHAGLPGWLSGDLSLAVPMLPDTAMRVIGMTSAEDISIIKLSELVAKDQVLASRVLGLANSAFIASATNISTVRDAIVRLGTTAVRNLVVTVSMASRMQDRNTYGQRGHDLFSHALGTAYMARLIVERVDADADEAFLCGLVHDIGKLVILKLAYEFNRSHEAKLGAETIEQVVVDHHAQVGSAALRRWRLPQTVDEPVLYHHAYASAPAHPRESAVCYLANRLSHRYGFGCGVEESDLAADDVFNVLGLDAAWLEQVDARAPGLVNVASKLLG